jgi:hypothetical protein
MLHGGVSTAMDFTEIMSLYVTAAWSFAHFWLWKESSYILDFGFTEIPQLVRFMKSHKNNEASSLWIFRKWEEVAVV